MNEITVFYGPVPFHAYNIPFVIMLIISMCMGIGGLLVATGQSHKEWLYNRQEWTWFDRVCFLIYLMGAFGLLVWFGSVCTLIVIFEIAYFTAAMGSVSYAVAGLCINVAMWFLVAFTLFGSRAGNVHHGPISSSAQ